MSFSGFCAALSAHQRDFLDCGCTTTSCRCVCTSCAFFFFFFAGRWLPTGDSPPTRSNRVPSAAVVKARFERKQDDNIWIAHIMEQRERLPASRWQERQCGENIFPGSSAVSACVILSFIVRNIQPSKKWFCHTSNISNEISVNISTVCYSIALWASQHTNAMHDRQLDPWHPPEEDCGVLLRTMGTGVTFRLCRERCLESGKWEKKSHCSDWIVFHWFIAHRLISAHLEVGPLYVTVSALSVSLFSLACSLHFIINWNKPFFEVQEPSREMTAPQTMNTKQKDNEHCLNIQVSRHEMGRRGKKSPCFIVSLSREWTCLRQ